MIFKSRMSLVAALLLLLALIASAPAVTINVPSGLHPNIQAGIDSATAGDTVLVACGEYTEHGIKLKKDIWLLSETGTADCVTLDGEGAGQILECDSLSAAAVIKGFTFTGGQFATGGAVSLTHSSPIILQCNFLDNAGNFGGGMYCVTSSSPRIEFCVFAANTANNSGGGLFCSSNSSPEISHCSFVENWAYWGGGIHLDLSCQLVMEYSIVADSENGEAVRCGTMSSALLICCDLHNNADGDWVGCVAGQDEVDNNFSLDPLFCGVPGSGNYYLRSDSPCSGANNPCRVDVGALPVFCGNTVTGNLNWSTLKALY